MKLLNQKYEDDDSNEDDIVDKEPEMIDKMKDRKSIDVVVKLLEQKAVDNYEAAFYDILDLSEERESGSIKSRFPSTVWKRLRSAAHMEMVKMNDEVKAWLMAFDDKVS
ncbi:hypothetical protein BC938DRAFT_474597 [Jimgerdemannia flammicorona]|uniref:Uncharacterized protein n=1 Tax=Jimgerdemannia flammicorona TaxID=994334 RepID=A0A433Q1W0_9FUNG|nr:hypothetical protein BC938DRAFT_474597 [Jimgerdemannia flammicorona]